jgi:hypothetical protein
VACALHAGFIGNSTAARADSQNLGASPGLFVDAQRYDADVHQKALKRPSSWCGQSRPNDPLLREAIRMVTAASGDTFGSYRHTHGIPKMDRREVVLVQDQRGKYWEVMFFDAQWRHLGFGYGEGA